MFSDGDYRPSVSVLSMHSLAEHSEPISETEEIESVRRLLKQGNRAFKKAKYKKAISCYSEALEIEDDNTQILMCRAAAYMETNQYGLAKKDADHIIKINPNVPQAYYLQGISYDHLDDSGRAIRSFLKALQLDQEHEQQLADNILVVASNICTLSEDALSNIDEMSVTEQLLLVGRHLQKSNEYSVSIDVLLVANNRSQDVQNKLLSLYYIGQSYEYLKNSLLAVEYLQKCLVLCLQEKNPEFEAACYYTLGQIYYNNGYIQEFLVNFVKLLAAIEDLEGVRDSVLELDLHKSSNVMNIYETVCAAYSGLGEHRQALIHAKAMLNLALCESDSVRLQKAHLLVANLYFKTRAYTLALNHYEAYMATCKKLHDRAGMATAYGFIGVVYKTLHNHKLAESYLEQQCRISEKLKDYESQASAFLHLGEISDNTSEFEKALKHFQSYLRMSRRLDEFETEVRALLRIGDLHKSYCNFQHALHFYEQSLNLADKIESRLLQNMCRCQIASILVKTEDHKDFKRAKVLLETCIFDNTVLLKMYNTDCIAIPDSIQNTRLMAFDLLQIVLQKLSRPDDALVFAEMEKSQMFDAYVKQKVKKNSSLPTTKQVNKILDMQDSTVLFYTMTNDFIIIFVLKPGKGCVRTERIELTDSVIWNQLDKALDNLHTLPSLRSQMYEVEYRALPLEDSETHFLQKNYNRRSTRNTTDDGMMQKTPEDSKFMEKEKPTRILYDLLVFPVLSEIKKCHKLTIIPDKNLFQVPFDSLEDVNGVCIGEIYRLTMAPSLKVLEYLSKNILLKAAKEQSCLESTDSRNTSSDPIYLDDSLSVVVPPKDRPFAPFSETVNVAPKMSQQKCNNPKYVSFGRNHFDVVKVEKDEVCQFELRKLQQNTEKSSTLITSTWCGKEVPSVGTNTIEEYQQTCGANLSVVIGSPHLPDKARLNGKDWVPPSEYQTAHRECHDVAEYLGTEAIVAKYASKQMTIKEIPNATLIHLALPGCWKKGVLACACDETSFSSADGVYPEESYQLSTDDISALDLRAQLVVISGCYGNHHRNVDLSLPCAFLAAGAKCFLLLLWATPDAVLQKFWYHFYSALQNGSYLSKAVAYAKMSIKKDERFKDHVFWSPFVLIGIDQYVNLSAIKKDMLDQQLNRVEGQILSSLPTDTLNYKTPGVKQNQLTEMKGHLSKLLMHHQKHPNAIVAVQDLLKEWQHLFTQSSPTLPVCLLPQCAIEAPAAIPLLHLVGFHFQARGASTSEPYVIWPQWDHSELLGPVLQATEALIDVCASAECAHSLARVLDSEINHLSSLLDLLCLMKHAPELQLKKSDHLVSMLWTNHVTRTFLLSIGLQEVGRLILFKNNFKNKSLLTASMKCICAILGKKGSALLNRLDPKYIGLPPPKPVPPPKKNRLPSLNPVVFPGNKMTFSTPWWSQRITQEETKTKVDLAKSLTNTYATFNRQTYEVNKLHNTCIQPQANESLMSNCTPKEKQQVIKVLPGRTPSCERVPVNSEITLSVQAIQQRRDYAHFVFNSRLDDVKIREEEAVKRLFLPYVQNR
ncbi:uncharacterized protein [Antedon mediterranea]|uniref:uncharacterized protein n=1 Tax=Antedon mediterranea TaxID=105859 RepID=UPI003AF5F260